MSEPDRIDDAFAAWRAATDAAAPSPALLEAVARATAAPPATVAGALWSFGRHAVVGLAVAAALLAVAATRSLRTLEARAAVAVEAMLP